MRKNNYLLLLIIPLLFCSFKTIEPTKKKALGLSIYLQLQGIVGDATDQYHPNWINVASYKFNAKNSRQIGQSGAAGVGRATGSDLTIKAVIADKSLTKLIDRCLKSTLILEGILDITESGAPVGNNVFAERVELTEIIVRSVSITGTDPLAGTVDVSFTLQFREIKRTLQDLINGNYNAPVDMEWNYQTNSGN
ncbi:Type VI protein secretion system component Hcp (secreted cytotoxin) [Spirosomataceae bacterium TFI 002]|nr:Type VI protein secretion system component Hcp (secreted cytotoxin) [Spirosomataceae bacterium TFI 002]